MRSPFALALSVAIALLGFGCSQVPTAESPAPASNASTAPAASVAAAPAPAALPAVPAGPPLSGGPREYEKLELTQIINPALNVGGRDYARGERLYKDVACRMCHLFNGGDGGIGPDLSGVSGRFGVYQILESILEPNVNISDLYGMKEYLLRDGKIERGRPANSNDPDVTAIVRTYSVNPANGTAYFDFSPQNQVRIPNSEIVEMWESEESLMIPGLINGLKEYEVADLLAYLITAGNPSHKMFQPAAPPAPGAARLAGTKYADGVNGPN